MKMLSTAILATAVVFALGTVSGQTANPPKGNAGAQAACCMDSKAQMSQMEEHMQRMRALHDKMASAAPDERQKLMTEQRQEMQQGMAMMQQMQHGGAMMGDGAKGGMMMGQKGKPADQKTQMQMMERRMDMMQMMMQSMMDQQGVAAGAMMPAPAK